MHIKTKILSQK